MKISEALLVKIDRFDQFSKIKRKYTVPRLLQARLREIVIPKIQTPAM